MNWSQIQSDLINTSNRIPRLLRITAINRSVWMVIILGHWVPNTTVSIATKWRGPSVGINKGLRCSRKSVLLLLVRSRSCQKVQNNKVTF